MGNVGMLVSRSVIRAALNATVIAGLVVVAGCGGRRSADYYDALQVALRAEGNLRTETAPEDAPYDAADLARNFERIALYREAVITRTGGEDNWSRSPLRRWEGPLKYHLFGSAVTPEDRIEVARLMDRIAGLTGLEIAESEDDLNLVILITTPDERDVVSAKLDSVSSALSEAFALWRRSPTLVCFGAILGAGEDNYRIVAAMVSIGSETGGLMRRSCLHEEIVQTFGLTNDHPDVRPSIFNDDGEFALLTEHDEHLLRILYDPRLEPGMTAEEAMPIVRRIVAGIPLDRPTAKKPVAENTVEIQVPPSTVLPEYAAYLGKWVGKWGNTWPVEFTVWRVSENGRGSLRYRHKERVDGSWSKEDEKYKIKERKLVFRSITIEIDTENSNTATAVGRFPKRTRTTILTKIE